MEWQPINLDRLIFYNNFLQEGNEFVSFPSV